MFDSLTEYDKLIFVHIFKCAGTYFVGGLRQSYDDVECYLVNVDEVSDKYWKNLSKEQRQSVKFVHGHMDFGIHTELEAPSVYITTLRDPVDRILSVYYYLQEERCAQNILYPLVTQYSLKECMDEELYRTIPVEWQLPAFIQMNNHQTRVLAGICHEMTGLDFGDISALFVDDDDLQNAIFNIEQHVSFLGLTHETQLYWEQIHRKFGLIMPPKSYSHTDPRFINARRNGPKREEVDEDTVQAIRAFNKLDCQLYDWAVANIDRINTRSIIRC